MIEILFIVLGYLAGSVPFGVLVSRAKGIDIRQVGSGNIGATNVARALGRRWGVLVFGLDFFKGFGPVLAARLVGSAYGADDPFREHDAPVLAAMAAVLGHVFPPWLGFRGGKAGATGLGVGAVLCWPAMLAAACVWFVTVAATRYVSLGTILGGIAFVAAYLSYVVWLQWQSPFDRVSGTLTLFCILVVLLVIVRHHENVRRLLSGTESKIW